ncbi:MAG TPA: hypothetical protein VKN99_26510 [Polyangia bacterium]|nr:hypothetical protein [Polyangia bacterium]
MIATVTYEGAPIVKGAAAREAGPGGVFIECEFPMPVGTRLQVQLDRGGPRPGRVVRVVEAQQGAGMTLEWTGEAGPTPPPADAGAGEAGAGAGAHGSGRRRRRRSSP